VNCFTFFRCFAASLVAIAGLGLAPHASSADDPPLIVFAAASLKNALDEIGSAWQHQTGQLVRISYAGTSALARQIEQGAPADLFISADPDWMDYLADRQLVGESTVLLGNRLVLVAPRDSSMALRLTESASLATALGDGRLALANVTSVPAGRYARTALESLGLWAGVSDRLVQTDNVRAALRLVARGEAPLGIVYATDARAEPLVRVVDVFDESLHPPIRYVMAPVSGSASPQARAFLDYLSSGAARRVFEAEGFAVLANSPQN
jgi:molybdate transport system substrate-binding protein